MSVCNPVNKCTLTTIMERSTAQQLEPQSFYDCKYEHYHVHFTFEHSVGTHYDLTVGKKSMTASKAGENPGSSPNSDSSTRSRSSWSPVINIL